MHPSDEKLRRIHQLLNNAAIAVMVPDPVDRVAALISFFEAEISRRWQPANGNAGVLPLRLDDGRLLAVDSIAGQAHPDAQPDGFPAELTLTMGWIRCRYVRMDTEQRKAAENQQRFSLGTKYHDAMRRVLGRNSGCSSGTIGFPALVEAVEALGAAVEAELSRLP